VISRGDIVCHEGELMVEAGRGQFLRRGPADKRKKSGETAWI